LFNVNVAGSRPAAVCLFFQQRKEKVPREPRLIGFSAAAELDRRLRQDGLRTAPALRDSIRIFRKSLACPPKRRPKTPEKLFKRIRLEGLNFKDFRAVLFF